MKIVFDTGESIPFQHFCGKDLSGYEINGIWYLFGRNDYWRAGPNRQDAVNLKFYLDRLHEGNDEYADPRCPVECSEDCCTGKKQLYRAPAWLTEKPKASFSMLRWKPRRRSGEWVYVEDKPKPIRNTLGKCKYVFYRGWYIDKRKRNYGTLL